LLKTGIFTKRSDETEWSKTISWSSGLT